jgi:hypothetical protein
MMDGPHARYPDDAPGSGTVFPRESQERSNNDRGHSVPGVQTRAKASWTLLLGAVSVLT